MLNIRFLLIFMKCCMVTEAVEPRQQSEGVENGCEDGVCVCVCACIR